MAVGHCQWQWGWQWRTDGCVLAAHATHGEAKRLANGLYMSRRDETEREQERGGALRAPHTGARHGTAQRTGQAGLSRAAAQSLRELVTAVETVS